MIKLRTHIEGLDMLFNGGINLDIKGLVNDGSPSGRDTALKERERLNNDGIVIVLRGEQGCHKTLLALQLLHGLMESFIKDSAYKHFCFSNPPEYFSLNKNRRELSDMYLDFAISEGLSKLTEKMIKRIVNTPIGESTENQQDIKFVKEICEKVFNADNEDDMSERVFAVITNDNVREEIYNVGIYRWLYRQITDRLIYYNSRQNTLDFKRNLQLNRLGSTLVYRRHDDIGKYYPKGAPAADWIKENFINMKINVFNSAEEPEVEESDSKDESEGKINKSGGKKQENKLSESPFYTPNSSLELMDIMGRLEKGYENIIEELKKQSSDSHENPGDSEASPEDDRKIRKFAPGIVIEGFSSVSDKDLPHQPYTHLVSLLRQLSPVSILVFDERIKNMCDGDIIIDMRKNIAKEEEYTFFELEITKNVFQPATLGHHQYKKKGHALIIYPSVHRLLTSHFYIENKIHSMHHGILEDTFEAFMRSRTFINPKETVTANEAINEYLDSDVLYTKQLDMIDLLSGHRMKDDVNDASNAGRVNILRDILFSNKVDTRQRPTDDIWTDHYNSTGIIGNPHSYKRHLSIASAFFDARVNYEHTIFILFDKNENDMRKHMGMSILWRLP